MNELTKLIVSIILFSLTYIGLLTLPKLRPLVALLSAILFLATLILPITRILDYLNFNILLMLCGIMGSVALFIDSNMTALLGDALIAKSKDLKWALVLLCLFTGFISAFIDNVATVLIIAPIAINLCKRAEISPVPALIGVTISSNLQGAATLVGDTTSILLGGSAHMNFFDFFIYEGKPGLFFIVQIAAIVSAVPLYIAYRKYKQLPERAEKPQITSVVPSILLLFNLLALIVASLIPALSGFDYTSGIICMTVFAVGLTHRIVFNRDQKLVDDVMVKESKRAVFKTIIKEIDWQTLLLIGSLLVVVGGIVEGGVVSLIASGLSKLSGNVFVIYTIIVFVSVALSAVIDNIPYVAAMLPVAAQLAMLLGISPTVLYFGLVSGATLGGNITPIGASANITTMGILKKEGYHVKMREFMKISVPFTLAAVLTGYVLIWLLFGL